MTSRIQFQPITAIMHNQLPSVITKAPQLNVASYLPQIGRSIAFHKNPFNIAGAMETLPADPRTVTMALKYAKPEDTQKMLAITPTALKSETFKTSFYDFEAQKNSRFPRQVAFEGFQIGLRKENPFEHDEDNNLNCPQGRFDELYLSHFKIIYPPLYFVAVGKDVLVSPPSRRLGVKDSAAQIDFSPVIAINLCAANWAADQKASNGYSLITYRTDGSSIKPYQIGTPKGFNDDGAPINDPDNNYFREVLSLKEGQELAWQFLSAMNLCFTAKEAVLTNSNYLNWVNTQAVLFLDSGILTGVDSPEILNTDGTQDAVNALRRFLEYFGK